MFNLFKKTAQFNIKCTIQIVLTDNAVLTIDKTYNKVKHLDHGKNLFLSNIKENDFIYLKNYEGFDHFIYKHHIKRIFFKTLIINEVK